MTKSVICVCGKEWEMWRGNLSLHEEEYSFRCTCGARLSNMKKDSVLERKSVPVKKKAK